MPHRDILLGDHLLKRCTRCGAAPGHRWTADPLWDGRALALCVGCGKAMATSAVAGPPIARMRPATARRGSRAPWALMWGEAHRCRTACEGCGGRLAVTAPSWTVAERADHATGMLTAAMVPCDRCSMMRRYYYRPAGASAPEPAMRPIRW